MISNSTGFSLVNFAASILHHAYLTAGLRSTLKLYPGARHEVFNETHRDRVTQDLLSWLDSSITETAA